MEKKFTPGPWRNCEPGSNFQKGRRFIRPNEPGEDPIATVSPRKGMEANARLIAVAPELLQALEWLLPLAEDYLKSAPGHPDNAKLESARWAINKAYGR